MFPFVLLVLVPLVLADTQLACVNLVGSASLQGTNTYQTASACRSSCGSGYAYVGLKNGNQCYCLTDFPDTESADSCNVGCTGYGSDMCGGSSDYSIYVGDGSGDITNAEEAQAVLGNDSGSSSSSSSAKGSSSTSSIGGSSSATASSTIGTSTGTTSSTTSTSTTSSTTDTTSSTTDTTSSTSTETTSSTTSATSTDTTSTTSSSSSSTSTNSQVTVITLVGNGGTTTIVRTATATSPSETSLSSSTASATASATAKSTTQSKNNTGAIVGGVVGGLAGLAIIIGAIFFFCRRNNDDDDEKDLLDRSNTAKSQKNVLDMPINNPFDHPNDLLSDRLNSTKLTDPRLNPVMMGRKRLSEGSLIDGEDYSRKILHVANPEY